jgi:hypothetical protein
MRPGTSSGTLKMEALRSSKTSEHISAIWYRNPNDHHLINHHCENLKTYNIPLCWILCHYLLMCSTVIYYLATCNLHFLQELGRGIFHINSIPEHSLLVFWRQSCITQSGGYTIVSFPLWFNAKAAYVRFVVLNVAAFSLHVSSFPLPILFHINLSKTGRIGCSIMGLGSLNPPLKFWKSCEMYA